MKDAVLSCASGAALAFAMATVLAFALFRPTLSGGASGAKGGVA